MQNPFTMPLQFGPNTGFDNPSDWDDDSLYDNENEPDFTGLGDAPAAYRGVASDVIKDPNPAYVGQDQLGYLNNPGIKAAYEDVYPSPGSVDLVAPRQAYGVPGTDRIIHSIGPVSGDNNTFDGNRAALNTPNPGYAGPVTGGPDYATIAATNYFASQAQMYSEQAQAAALLVAF